MTIPSFINTGLSVYEKKIDNILFLSSLLIWRNKSAHKNIIIG